ncbi:hypothetical protein LXL04_039656 [Taraxacum kok-saghyz]
MIKKFQNIKMQQILKIIPTMTMTMTITMMVMIGNTLQFRIIQVLKTKDYIHVEQNQPFDNIHILPRSKLLKIRLLRVVI